MAVRKTLEIVLKKWYVSPIQPECKKTLVREVLFFFLLYCGFMALFIGAGTIAASLPHTARLENNFRKSAIILFNEGTYPRHLWTLSDNSTDALMLNVALGYRYSQSSPLTAAMQNTLHHTVPEHPLTEIELFAFAKSPGKQKAFQTSTYNRYFFGTAVVLKIFHYFAALKTFETALGTVVAVLAFILFAMLHKQSGWIKSSAFLVLLLTTQFYICFHSLQFSPGFLLGLLTLAVCRHTPDKLLPRYAIFFSCGMLFAYFDLLTTPLLSVMIPALFIVDGDFKRTAGKMSDWIKVFAGYPFFWFIGYVASWGSKLIISDIYNGKFLSALDSIILRTSCDGEMIYTNKIYRWTGILCAFEEFFSLNKFIFILIAVVFAVGVVICLCKKRFNDSAVAAGFLAYSIIPLVYMMVMVNHSIVHPWMSYRNISLSVTSLLLALGTLLRKS